jgi:hypothetical protein
MSRWTSRLGEVGVSCRDVSAALPLKTLVSMTSPIKPQEEGNPGCVERVSSRMCRAEKFSCAPFLKVTCYETRPERGTSNSTRRKPLWNGQHQSSSLLTRFKGRSKFEHKSYEGQDQAQKRRHVAVYRAEIALGNRTSSPVRGEANKQKDGQDRLERRRSSTDAEAHCG